MNILITAASSAKAHQLKRELNSTEILLGDYLDLPDVMLKSGRMLKLPSPQADTYPHQMLAFCLDNHIDTVYLLNATEAVQLQPAEQLFDEYGIKLIPAHG
ncbi:hypothetical protein KHS38_00590 [Mucilaginibacter sp. Bleaf8]|uniref:hypothetical protein n=1 Tax=Mucilaginibacter sp. Bleaf8 TaxID=2834430 RepID=UPI001BCFA0B7|nr:hypothetical protein [Mucilaginibacter sp. Bleaf8]MBS7562885.1 hypothetical protein [Mucilaginibacter sp. Bleaf8]